MAILGVAASACGGYRKHGSDDDVLPGCSDVDGDRHGAGSACDGPDCDDENADVWDEADCEALCEADAHATGCPCDPRAFPEPETCYTGPEGTAGVGRCHGGLRHCGVDRWSPCVDQAVPVDEVCDAIDQDCDGAIDDGVQNECGTCGECSRNCVGRGDGCAPWDVVSEGTAVADCADEADCITLAEERAFFHVAWLANTGEGTISRIDTETREEVGRYLTSPTGISASPSPSRTSVDYEGAVVVANRAFGGQASVTRVLAEDCPDVDGDGRVETSADRADVLSWGDDECIAWNTDVGNFGGIARAIAVEDRAGLDGFIESRVWVGLYGERRYVELDREDGSETGREANVDPCTPYMAATHDGRLWSACLSSNLASFDTSDPDDVEIHSQPGSNYGLVIDWEGRVWTGGSCTVYDPDADEFTPIPGCYGASLAIDPDGDAWIGNCNGGMCRIDGETLELTNVAAQSYGVAVDMDGFIWGVPAFSGYVEIVDPETEEVERILDDCGGGPCLNGTYTYGDFTGFALVNHTGAVGLYTHVFEGCRGGWLHAWQGLDWEADTGPGRAVSFSARTADEIAALAIAPWIELAIVPGDASPIDVESRFEASGVEHGRFLEVRAQLQAVPGEPAPKLYRMGVNWSCEL